MIAGARKGMVLLSRSAHCFDSVLQYGQWKSLEVSLEELGGESPVVAETFQRPDVTFVGKQPQLKRLIVLFQSLGQA